VAHRKKVYFSLAASLEEFNKKTQEEKEGKDLPRVILSNSEQTISSIPQA